MSKKIDNSLKQAYGMKSGEIPNLFSQSMARFVDYGNGDTAVERERIKKESSAREIQFIN